MGFSISRLLPSRVCCCCPFNLGLQALLFIIILLRLAGMVCSVFYGPYLYLVLTLAALYLAADFLVLYSVFWKGDKTEDCAYPNQKVWIIVWQTINIIAIIGLITAIVWYVVYLTFWGMTHEPIHLVVFIIISVLVPILVYTAVIMYALTLFLREQYIDSVLGNPERDEEDEGLTSGGRRVSV